MRVLLLPGIWPPDVGGPATHGPEFARFLVGRSHSVHVVTMGNEGATERPCSVQTISRARPFPIRYTHLALAASRAARLADVVYASATYAAAAAAATAARRPLVTKLVSDPAFERARRYGLFAGTLEDFQQERRLDLAALKAGRSLALRAARTVVVPSEYLTRLAEGWGVERDRIRVLPNAAPIGTNPRARKLEPYTFVFAGRLTPQKSLPTAIDALARVPEGRLLVLGDGPERSALEQHAERAGLNGRIFFEGPQPREVVLETLAGAYALVLPSAWENLPHAALEALAVGTPVVARAVGGVSEVVRDGVNGLLVQTDSAEDFARPLARLVASPELREELAAAARASVAGLDPAVVYGELESILARAAGL
jgi:glycosyltransferase involved in cell wall biosynthesis